MTSLPVTNLTAIPFEHDIQQLTKNFTGRRWIFDKIDEWLNKENKQNNRFFLLTGRPGTGKSAIAAQLTKIRKDIKAYHFCRAGDVETVRPNRIFRSLAAQLGKSLPLYGQALANTIKPVHLRVEVNVQIESMTGSQLTGVYIENLEESDPDDELDILIRAPFAELEKMYADKPQERPNKAVILIDSLDEAVTTTGDTNLVRLLAGLSNSDLPPWVRFIMTSRPENRVMREFKPLEPYNLDEKSEESNTDIYQYIKERVRETKLQDVLQEAKVAVENLSGQIVELSDGIFLYAELLLNDIEAQRQSINDLSALPKDIDDIYHNFLKRFTTDEWQNKYQPILGRLTVTQEPLTEEQLVNFTGIKPEQLRDYLGVVRQFLNEVKDKEGKKIYVIFHQSLRDYLLDKERNNDFWCDAQTQHKLIIDYYKKDSQSWEEVDLIKVDKYGLLHLPKHLDTAGREEEFYTLLTGSPKWMESKFQFFSRDTEYVDDLELAINKFSDPLESNQLLTLIKLYTARQVVHQRSSNYEDIDLKTLVLLGRETEALAYARLRKNFNRRFTALMAIFNALEEKSQYSSTVLDVSDVLNEAKEVAKLIDKVSLEVKTLLDFATALLKASNFTEAEKLADEIKNTFVKIKVLQKLAVALAQAGNTQKTIAVFEKVKELIDTIEENWAKAEALRELAAALSMVGYAQEANKFFSKAKKVSDAITDNLLKTDKLIDLALALVQAKKVNEASLIFNEAEKLARTIQTWEQIKVLPKLAIALSQVGFVKQAEEVFIEVKNIVQKEQNWTLADASTNLATALVQAQDITEATKLFREAIEVENGFEKGGELTKQLRKFAQVLVQAGFTKEAIEFFSDAIESANTIQNNWRRKPELLDLAGALARAKFVEEARAVFAEAEELALTSGEKESWQEKVLIKWAAALNLASFTQEAPTICNDYLKVNQAAQEIEQYWEEVSSYPRDAIEKSLMKNSEEKAELQELQQEQFMSIKAISLSQDKCFTKALSTLGLKEKPSQFLENLASWTPAFKEFDQKLLLNILQETTRIFGWNYPYWNDIYAKFTYSRHDFLPPKEVERLEACIQEAITIISSNIPKTKQFRKKINEYILDIVSAKLNTV
ncbi:ATP-binding protein [Rivularia sp. UHCC 0363]|uniref:ATP-binding protein n=1 Tax=Rivularia sp. UHCC 0363 TaxID=3110244 RepID=UPI002B2029C8|nr:ATP-binding protein [Rivularia sp. UHCC 0363]MEA5593459.1 ATP-binding protein [Rivularia sp. UHCC 0363]